MNLAHELKYWLPAGLQNTAEGRLCRWFYTGGEPFTDPFFNETISRRMNLRENALRVYSSLDTVSEWGEAVGGKAPAAFIFHVSRCGSTLLAQMLALAPDRNVLSEAPFFDEALRQRYQGASEEESTRLFRSALHLYGNHGGDVFVKTDSWHVFFYQMLRRLYPETLFVLLYREPAAVLRSQRIKRGMHAVPGLIEPELFGWSRSEIEGISFDDYLARVVERYYEIFLDIARNDGNVLLVNYKEGLAQVATRLLDRLGKKPTADEEAQLQERGRYNAKEPERIFSEPSELPSLDGQWGRAAQLYEELEILRQSAFQPVQDVAAQ